MVVYNWMSQYVASVCWSGDLTNPGSTRWSTFEGRCCVDLYMLHSPWWLPYYDTDGSLGSPMPAHPTIYDFGGEPISYPPNGWHNPPTSWSPQTDLIPYPVHSCFDVATVPPNPVHHRHLLITIYLLAWLLVVSYNSLTLSALARNFIFLYNSELAFPILLFLKRNKRDNACEYAS